MESQREQGGADPDAMITSARQLGRGQSLDPITNKLPVRLAPTTLPRPHESDRRGTAPANLGSLPRGYRNYVRVSPTDDRQGSAAAKRAKDLGSQAYVLDETAGLRAGLANAIASDATEAGYHDCGAPAAFGRLRPESLGLRGARPKIKASEPICLVGGNTARTPETVEGPPRRPR